jgi:hypothetical protein
MFRWTNRLDLFLASKDHGVCDPEDEASTIVFREAEFVECLWPASDQFDLDASLLAVPRDFDFSVLNRLNDASIRHTLYTGRYDDDSSSMSHVGQLVPGSNIFDILWLSATEILTLVDFDGSNWVNNLYSVTIQVSGISLTVHVHKLMKSKYNLKWDDKLNPPSELPLRFMAHLIAPIWDVVSAITLYFATAPPDEAAIALVPFKECNLSKTVAVSLINQSLENGHRNLDQPDLQSPPGAGVASGALSSPPAP